MDLKGTFSSNLIDSMRLEYRSLYVLYFKNVILSVLHSLFRLILIANPEE